MKNEIRTIALSELKPAPYNPRKISKEALKGLAASIKRFGLVQPIVVNKKTGLVVGGHQRLEAMKLAGEKSASVLFVDLNEQEEKALNIALNAPTIAGTYTDELQPILDELREEIPHDFIDLRFDQMKLDFNGEGGDLREDDVPDLPKEPIARPGDLWQLGKHRLICGDSSNGETYEQLMGKEKADLIFTDPPYGVSFERGKFQGRNNAPKFDPIANDELRGAELTHFLISCFQKAHAVAKDCGIYVWAPSMAEGYAIHRAVAESGFKVQSQLIWRKTPFVMGRADYHWQHEVCWYGFKGKNHPWYGGRNKSTVWDCPKAQRMDKHPTMKPVALAVTAINNSSRIGDIVLDIFGGSGSTLIGCQQTDRRCFMVELSPAYCDVIIERFEKFTGYTAKKL